MTAGTPRRYRAAAGTRRRRPRVRRASPRLSQARAAALLVMLTVTGVTYGLAATPAFGFERLEVSGATITPDAAIRERVAIAPGTNLVGLSTQRIVDRLRDLPAIDDAVVSVGLPDVLRVAVRERRPVVVWGVGTQRFAVDAAGLLFADLADVAAEDPDIAAIPVVTDERVGSASLAIRSVLDPVDLDAATRLASLDPSQIGSSAASLAVIITDERGFTVSSGPKGWLAVFGKYGRSQRTPALVPGQVQLLAKLLVGREATLDTIILADDRDGTYLPKPTPRPSASPKP